MKLVLALGLWLLARTDGLVSPRAPTAVNVLDRVLGFGSATVCWQPPDESGGVTGYNLLAQQPARRAQYLRNASATDRCVAVQGLEPATQYSFIVASAGRDPAQSVPVGPLLLPATTPATVTGMRSLHVAERQMSIGWTLPVGDPALIRGVRLYHAGNGSAVTPGLQPGARTKIVIRKLRPATRYSFQVQLWNAIGPSPLSSPLTVTTRGASPNSVGRVLISEATCQLAAASAGSVRGAWRCSTTVSWDAVGLHGKVYASRVRGYRVWSQKGPPQEPEEWRVLTRKTNQTSRVVSGLTASLWIRFRVAAINGHGMGDLSVPSNWMKTKASPPDKLVLSPTVTMPEPDKATVSWDRPAGGAIYGYMIVLQQGNYSCAPDGLRSAAAKRGLLLSTTEAGEAEAGPWEVYPELRWASNSSSQPSRVRVQGWVYAAHGGSHRLVLNWCGLGARLVLAKRVLTDSGLPAVNRRCVNHTSRVNLALGYHAVELQLECPVGADCSFAVTWAAPSSKLGPIARYALAHTPPLQPDSSEQPAEQCAEASMKDQPWAVAVNDTYSNGNSFQVGGLEPLTPYRFKVAAFNPQGTAPLSSPSEAAVTPQLPAQPPHSAHCPSSAHQSSQQLLFQWQRAAGLSRPVGGYLIQLRSGKSGGVLREEHSDFTRIRMDSLEPFTTYRFRVAAVGFEGITKWSQLSPICRTPADRPGTVGGLQVSKWPVAGAAIVQWAAAAPHGAPVSDYQLQLHKRDASTASQESSAEPVTVSAPFDPTEPVSFRLEELKSTEQYEVTVVARNSFGSSDEARLLLEPPQPPDPIRGLKASSIEVDSGSATKLTWESPEASGLLVRVTPGAVLPVSGMQALFLSSDGVFINGSTPSSLSDPRCKMAPMVYGEVASGTVSIPGGTPEAITCVLAAPELGCAADSDNDSIWISFRLKFGTTETRKGGLYLGVTKVAGKEFNADGMSGLIWDDLQGGLVIPTASGQIDTISEKQLGRDLGKVAKSNTALKEALWTIMLNKNGTAAVYLDQVMLRTNLSMPLVLREALARTNRASLVQLSVYNYKSQLTVADIALGVGAMPQNSLARPMEEPTSSLEWTSQARCAVLRTASAQASAPLVVSVPGQLPVIELVGGQQLTGIIALDSAAVTVILSVQLSHGTPSSLQWSLGEETVTLVADGAQSTLLLSWRSEGTSSVVSIPTGNWTVLAWVETGHNCQLWVDGELKHTFEGGQPARWADNGTFTLSSQSSSAQQLDAVAVYRHPLLQPALLQASQALAARRTSSLQTASAGVCGAGQAIDLASQPSTTLLASNERKSAPAPSVAEPTGSPWLSGAKAPGWIEADFGSRKVLVLIRALTVQEVIGRAVHQVTLDGTQLQEWTSSAGAQWLQAVPTAGTVARRVKITTVLAPGEVGWVQIVLRGCPEIDRAVYEKELPGVKSSVKLTGLAAGTNYNATVIATNNAGHSDPVQLTFRTARQPGQPEVPVVHLPGTRFAGTVRLTWQSPQSDMQVIGYRVLVQTKVHFLPEQVTAKKAMFPWRSQVVRTAGARTNTALTLPMYTPDGGVLMYQFAVQAISTVGHGTQSVWSEWVSKLSPSQMNELFHPPKNPWNTQIASRTAMHLSLGTSGLRSGSGVK